MTVKEFLERLGIGADELLGADFDLLIGPPPSARPTLKVALGDDTVEIVVHKPYLEHEEE